MTSRKHRRCLACGASLSGRGGRAVRCEPCQVAVDKERDRTRHEANRERLSTLRRLRRTGAAEPEPTEVVEYGGDGRVPPPGVARTPKVGAGDPHSDLPWMRQRDERVVAFYPAHAEPPRCDALGRPSPRRTARADADFGQMVNPAAGGMAYVPSPAVGRALADAQRRGSRFGPAVEPPVQLAADMYASAPHLTAQEDRARAEQAQGQQTVSGHLRRLGGLSAWSR